MINMAGPGEQLAQRESVSVGQEILQQLQRAIQVSAQKVQNQLPVVIRNTAVTRGGGNQALVTAGQSGPTTVLQVHTPYPSRTGGSGSTIVSKTSQADPVYAYKVKIINPAKKSDVLVRQLNKFTSKFESPTALRVKLIEEFKEQVPSTVDFSVGYYEGSQQAKVWLVTPDDLNTMYLRYQKGGSITLWCDGRSKVSTEEERRGKRKRDSGVRAEDSPKRMCNSSFPAATGISPGKAIELRMKNFEQLRYLQRLLEDGVLSEEEFTDLKRNILSSLRKL